MGVARSQRKAGAGYLAFINNRNQDQRFDVLFRYRRWVVDVVLHRVIGEFDVVCLSPIDDLFIGIADFLVGTSVNRTYALQRFDFDCFDVAVALDG